MGGATRLPTKKLFKQFDDSGTLDLDEWHNIFVSMCDPTEYAPALELVGSWSEWCRFKREWAEFREIILKKWLEEVEIKIRSDSIRKVVVSSASNPKSAQWLAEGKYKPTATKGRPSKAEVERAARIEAGVVKEVEDDVRRVLGNNSVN
jgi:hypothetical protein